jgi:hypothetical protein
MHTMRIKKIEIKEDKKEMKMRKTQKLGLNCTQ